MNILVTGATGFIGRHLVPALLDQGHSITAIGRNEMKLQTMPWMDDVAFVCCDIHQGAGSVLEIPDLMMHLAWDGLPTYRSLHHFEQNLPADYRFIRALVTRGLQRVLVTGTCLEYGLQEGKLQEEMVTQPVTAYGLAKDVLRKFLQRLQQELPFTLQWVRLFYSYGPHQNENSLLAQLDRAISNEEQVFKMSGGEQLRDYLPVEAVAEKLALLAAHPECHGVINCCSGVPVSVRRLVEEHLAERGSEISLELGWYPYPEYEPMAFWGDSTKIENLCREVLDDRKTTD